MGKTKNKIRITVPSPAAESVTGSMIYIESTNNKILLDCGLHQSPNLKKQYAVNVRKLPFKPGDIDYIFILHAHADHSLLLPRLVKEGFCGQVIAPYGTKVLFSIMGKDSAYIGQKEKMALERKYKKQFEPIYEEFDIYESLKLFNEYGFREKIELNPDLSFEFYHAGHILGSAQIKLWVREGSQIKTVGYTSDFSNSKVSQFYTEKFEPIDKVQCLFGEATYGGKDGRGMKLADRDTDIRKIHDIIKNVCCDNKKKVLIPSFSLSRAQNILTHLYNIFGEDDNFKIPVLIDSPLSISICQAYMQLLEGDNLELFKKVMSWKNVKLIIDYKDSQTWQTGNEPCIAIASSGMMTAGRSVSWAKTLLPERGNHILFVGFSTENSLANKIRNGHKQKTITIEKKVVPNRCGITELHSFSSHADRSGLVKYYSTINADKICLLHSEQKIKIEFARELQEEIYKKAKTTKVISLNKSSSILL